MIKVIRTILFIFVLVLIITMRSWGVILSALLLLAASKLFSFKFDLPSPNRTFTFSIVTYLTVALASLLIWFFAGGDVIVKIMQFTNHFRIAPSGIDNVFMAVDATKNGSYASFADTVQFKSVLEQKRWEARLGNFVEKFPFAPALYAYLSLIVMISYCIIFGWASFLMTSKCSHGSKTQSRHLSIPETLRNLIIPVFCLIAISVLLFLAGDIGGFEWQATVVLHNRNILPGPIFNNMVCHMLLVLCAIGILPSNERS